MPTSYTSLLGLALPVTGELSGTWGTTVNDYITQYVDSSVAGTQTISGTQTAVTLSVTNGSSLVTAGSGSTGSAQFQIINCTGNPAGLLTITAPASSRQYIIINATSTSQSVKIVGTGPTTGVTILSGEKAHVAWNGSDFVKIATQSGNGSFVDLTVSGSMTLSGGTANGVLYLNGSKVATSGSALVFDGTNLGVGVTPSAWGTYKAMQIGATTPLALDSSGGVGLNYYYDGSVYRYVGSSSATIYSVASGQHRWYTAASGTAGDPITFSQAMTLDASGRLLVGTTTTTNNLRLDEKVAIVGVNVPYNGMALTGYTGTGNAAYRPVIDFNRSRGTTDGSMTVLANNDYLGSIIFRGSDGTSFQDSAMISAEVDGTPGASDMPGRLTFWTSPDGSASVTERMRLDSSGNLGLGVTPSAWGSAFKVLQLANGTSLSNNGQTSYYQIGANNYYDGTNYRYIASNYAGFHRFSNAGAYEWHTAPSGTAGNAISFTQAMTLDASGNLGVGITSPTSRLHLKGPPGSNPNTNGVVFQASGSTNNFGAIGIDNSTGDFVVASGSGAALRFYTNSDLATTNERARITSGGNLDLQKNLGLGGTSATTSGTGITFPATQSASTDANTLDDYEEGTWTPALASTGASFTYPRGQYGSYCKIGGLVYAQFYIGADATGTTSNSCTLTGLPFTSANLNALAQASASAWVSSTTALGFTVNNNDTQITIWKQNVGAATGATAADCTGGYIVGHCVYRAS